MIALTERRKDLIADGAGLGRQIVHALFGPQNVDEIAGLQAVLGKRGDVDAGDIHGHPSSQRQPGALEPDAALSREVAQEAIRITQGNGSDAGRLPSPEAGTIAYAAPGIDRAHLQHPGLKPYDRLHRVGSLRSGIYPIERHARSPQIEVVVRAKEDAG